MSDATETREPTSSDPLLMRTKEPSTTMKKERKTLASQDNDNSALLYSIFKKVCIVVGVYLIGYMGWSIAWLITPIVLAVTREYYKKAAGRRHDIAKALAEGNEKEIITARISDLPAWVMKLLNCKCLTSAIIYFLSFSFVRFIFQMWNDVSG